MVSFWNSERSLALIRSVGGGVHKTRFIHTELEMSLGIHKRISSGQVDTQAEVSSLEIQICASFANG